MMIASVVIVLLTIAGLLNSHRMAVMGVAAWAGGYATLLVHFWTTKALTPEEKTEWRRRMFSFWSPVPVGEFRYLFSRNLGAHDQHVPACTVDGIYNYRDVDGSLATSGQPNEEQLLYAARQGFEVVIDLALHGDPRYSLKDERASVRSLGMEYVHIPVDFQSPRQLDLEQFFSAMDAHRGKKILVHCAANKRVTAFLGLHRTMKLGWPVEKAFALMHTVWEPDPVWARFISEREPEYPKKFLVPS